MTANWAKEERMMRGLWGLWLFCFVWVGGCDLWYSQKEFCPQYEQLGEDYWERRDEDLDGDGYSACHDCDDNNASIHPNATWYLDSDQDGSGDGTDTKTSCEQPEGYAAEAGDCDDSDPVWSEVCGWEEVSAGSNHTCGRRSNGTLRCWGLDENGQVSETPIPDFTEMTAGSFHTCGLHRDGTLTCWGWDSYGQVSVPPGASDFTQVTAGERHTCGLHGDGTLTCLALLHISEPTRPGRRRAAHSCVERPRSPG